ncbi:MAG TPA: hypothetical protein VFW62_12850, partial [bacterium]|nr:hypothetical protein [bacterium]
MTSIHAKNRALAHRPPIELAPAPPVRPDQPAPVDRESVSPDPGFEAAWTGRVSKLFQYASLFERRRQIQNLLAEIHPPELRLGRRSPRELEKDPFVQALERVEAPVRKQLAGLLRDRLDAPLGLAELKSLYESPHLETFFRKYSEVREELLRQNPSYLRQRSLEAAIIRLGGEGEPVDLPSRDT